MQSGYSLYIAFIVFFGQDYIKNFIFHKKCTNVYKKL